MPLAFPYSFTSVTAATGAQLDANFKAIGDLIGAASGVPTLDASSKVVQEPASKGLASGIASLDSTVTLVEKAKRFTDGTTVWRYKIIALGTWNSHVAGGGSLTKAVAHGLVSTKIMGMSAVIINTAGNERHELCANLVGRMYSDSTNINLVALATASGGILDAAAFNASTGFITVWYSE